MKQQFLRIYFLAALAGLFVLGGWLLLPQSTAAQAREQVYYVTVEHGLTSPSAGLVRRALREAEAANANSLVVEIRGGGSLSTAWPLARELAAARIPVVTYVGPRGVQGGPVGTLLVTSGHVAAMAPDASIGFAAPLVDVPASFSSSTQQLLVDDAVKQLTQWAGERGHNADWVEQAARQGAIIRAEQAQQLMPPVIDVVATEDELLVNLQGRRVKLATGQERSLETLGAAVVRVRPSAWEGLGQLIALPTIAFVLFVLGGIALYLEFANPGLGIPGVSGALLIIAALVGFVLAEVRPLAVLMLAGGLVLVGLEHAVMSHGGLTIAGLVMLVLGALYLVDPMRSPGLQVSYGAIIGVAAILTLGAVGLVSVAMRMRHQPPVTGQEALIGQLADVRRAIAPEGLVFVSGALWSAWSDEGPIEVGELVQVAGVDGLRLYVQKIEQSE